MSNADRLRVLWILGELPLPADSGSRLRIMGLLREQAKRHDVTAAVFDPGDSGASRLSELRGLCREVVTLPWRGRPTASRLLIGAALSAGATLPYSVLKYGSPEADAALQTTIARGFHLVQCENIGFRRYLAEKTATPRIINTQNVEAHVWRRRAGLATNPVIRAYLMSQARKMARYEASLLGQYDAAIAVTEGDAAALRREYGISRVVVVPNGVDTRHFTPSGAPDPGSVLFTGAMDYAPNDDAVRYFLAEVWPRVLRRRPEATFTVAGRAPSPGLAKAASASRGVVVTGEVPDMRPYLARAAVVVVPLRMGGGSRLKILEAMAMGKAIVSTTIGAEGLHVRDGEHLRLADAPDAFAKATCTLLDDSEAANWLGAAARHLAASSCSWEACADTLEEFWRSMCANRGMATHPLSAKQDGSR